MHKPPRFLVVLEDDDGLRRAWVRAAHRQSVPVVPCATLVEAMDALMSPGAAGLITDFQLAEGTSLDAIRLARKLAPPLPVSVATGNAAPVKSVLEDEGLAAEVQPKPVEMVPVLRRLWPDRDGR